MSQHGPPPLLTSGGVPLSGQIHPSQQQHPPHASSNNNAGGHFISSELQQQQQSRLTGPHGLYR